MNEHDQYKIQANGQTQIELMLSYLISSNFYQYLRNTYPHFLRLSEEQKRNLVVSSQLFRVKQDKSTLLINYNQPTVSILVYGQLKCGYFYSNVGQQQIQFFKKSAILMLNRSYLQDFLKETQIFYCKNDILQHILPTQLLGLQKRGYKFLNLYSEMHEGMNKSLQNLNKPNKLGIFVLYQGNYVVISKKGIKLTQISSDYFGEETLWGQEYEYYIRPQSYQFKYIFIPKQTLIQISNNQMIHHLQDFFLKKQKLRQQIQNNYTQNLNFTQNFLKNSPVKRIKKKFTPEQVEQFNNILGKMAKQGYKPKWRREQDQLQRQRILKLKQKRVYIPKKPKSKYFSTLTDNTYDFGYHNILHQQQGTQPYQPKLYLHQRAKTQILFKRKGTSHTEISQQKRNNGNNRTEPTSQDKVSQIVRKNSHRYYSHNYDRSYSVGMSNLIKMRKYDEMKKSSTLQRGQKILTLQEMTQALSVSFQKLHISMSTSARDKKIDPTILMNKTMKQNKLLIDKFMQSRGGFATWR